MTRQHTKSRQIKSSSKCLIWVISALLCAPPAAWAQPAAVPTLGSPSSAELSPSVERRLGEAIMVQGRRDPEYINDPDLSQYLNEMGRKIDELEQSIGELVNEAQADQPREGQQNRV